MTTEPTRRMGYVRELDGVRAFAVVLVMFGHLHLPFFQNAGELGVDAFFVLSGFLITRLLLEEHRERGRVNVRHFYARRALRLWPALYTVCAVGVVWSLVVLEGGDRRRLLLEVAASATYSYDIVERVVHSFGFMLYHTWSLAMEEQFYFVWPPIFVLALGRGKVKATGIGVAVVVVAITLARFAGTFGPLGLFDRRPDALLIGCITAIVTTGDRWPRWLDLGRSWVRIAPLAGAGAIIALGAVMPRKAGVADATVTGGTSFSALYLRWLSPWFALAVAGVIVVVVHARPVWSRPLALRPLVEIGRRSYGLYLWHLPIFVAVSNSWIHRRPTVVQLGVKLVAAFGVSWLSFLVVEQPALRLKARFARSDA